MKTKKTWNHREGIPMQEPTWAQRLVAVDVIPLTPSNGSLLVHTPIRTAEPYQGEQALPGVLMRATESIHEAAHRAIATKTSLDPAQGVFIQAGVMDETGRDPRSHAISIIFLFLTPETSGTLGDELWAPLLDQAHNTNLPFSHHKIISQGARALSQMVDTVEEESLKALFPSGFTTAQYINLSQSVGLRPQPGNTPRNLSSRGKGFLVKSEPARVPGASGRPSTLWKFTE